MHPARSGCLGPADQPEIGERRADHSGDLANLFPLDAGHGIEIDAQLVGMIQIAGTDRMRMELEAGEVGHPHERGGVARYDFFGGPARWETERDHLYPVGPRFRRALLIEKLTAGAVRIADEDVRTPARALERARRNREVIAREIELGMAALREQYLGGIRDRDLAAGNLQQFLFLRRRHL